MKKALLAFVVAGAFAATAVTDSRRPLRSRSSCRTASCRRGSRSRAPRSTRGRGRTAPSTRATYEPVRVRTLVPGVAGRVATGLKFDHGGCSCPVRTPETPTCTTPRPARSSRSYALSRPAHLHQRRRRDEGRGVVHRLAEAACCTASPSDRAASLARPFTPSRSLATSRAPGGLQRRTASTRRPTGRRSSSSSPDREALHGDDRRRHGRDRAG